MNPRAAFLIIAAVVAAVVLLVCLAVWWIGRQAGIRRSRFKAMKSERDLAINALDRIDEAADTYRDIYGPSAELAIQVRHIVRENRHERNKIE